MTTGHTLAAAATACAMILLLGLGALASCAAPDSPLGGILAVACADQPSSPPPGTAARSAPRTNPGAADPIADHLAVGDLRRWDGEQVANGAVIVEVGRRMRVPAWGQVIAVATAMQESSLRNLAGGDRDSVGLFQQRPSQGWGTPAQLSDPAYAAGRFYQALLAVAGWQQMPLSEAAQRVQHSAFPFAYQRWTADAITLVTAVGFAPAGDAEAPPGAGAPAPGPAPAPCLDAGGAVGRMLGAALAQVGDPYVYAATGPDAFDCSGLVVYAWRQAGYRLAVRTAEQMRRIAAPVPPGQERPGDLLFSQFNTPRVPGGAGHVAIVVSNGLLVEAARPGLPVRVRPYDPAEPALRLGRLPASALRPIPAARAAPTPGQPVVAGARQAPATP
jgi:cell wall-associated NlpC family hydrolase